MTNKLIKGIDDETWRKFVALCKLKNINVGDEVNLLLKKHLDKELRRLLK